MPTTPATPASADLPRIRGIQFALLAQVFPVLRHDTVKPVANAKLATTMLIRAAGNDPHGEPTRKLADDVEYMLDDGVDAIRNLGGWLNDAGEYEDLHNVLHECRKMAFTQMLLSGKKIVLPDETDDRRTVRVFSSRYVLLAWLLASLQAMEDGAVLHLAYESGDGLRANVERAGGAAAAAPAPLEDARLLALGYGWQVTGDALAWSARFPLAD